MPFLPDFARTEDCVVSLTTLHGATIVMPLSSAQADTSPKGVHRWSKDAAESWQAVGQFSARSTPQSCIQSAATASDKHKACLRESTSTAHTFPCPRCSRHPRASTLPSIISTWAPTPMTALRRAVIRPPQLHLSASPTLRAANICRVLAFLPVGPRPRTDCDVAHLDLASSSVGDGWETTSSMTASSLQLANGRTQGRISFSTSCLRRHDLHVLPTIQRYTEKSRQTARVATRSQVCRKRLSSDR